MQVAASEPSGDPVGGRVSAQRQFDDGGKDLGLFPADVESSAYVVIFFLRESAFDVSIVYRQVIRRDVFEDGVKAFRYGEDFSVEDAENYPAELILIDSYSKNTVGGTGVSFAWEKAAEEI